MEHDRNLNGNSRFLKIGFSEKVARCVERARARQKNAWFEIPDWAKIETLIDDIQGKINLGSNELASKTVTRKLFDKNPNIIRLSSIIDKNNNIEQGFFSYLPLNKKGVEILISGGFDGRYPKPEWIVDADEEPEAIYIWLVYLPGSFGRSIGMVANLFDSLTENCCPVFSRSVNNQSRRLSDGMGFMPAQQFYQNCKPGLMVAFPRQEVNRHKSPAREVHIARNIEDIVKVFSVRSATYLAEQFCFYAEEFDGNDFCATHLLGTIDGDPAGCIRIRYFADFAKIERLAVRYEYRNSKLAFDLARAAIKLCQNKGYRKILGHSRADLVRFWGTFGCQVRESREQFSFANILYTEIILDLPATDDAITADICPMMLIRPEGNWKQPGPLDISASEHDPRRKELLAKRTRSIGNAKIVKA